MYLACGEELDKVGEGKLTEEREHDCSVGDLEGECLVKDSVCDAGVDIGDHARGGEACLVGKVYSRSGRCYVWQTA